MTAEEMLKELGSSSSEEFNDKLGGWLSWSFTPAEDLSKRDRGILTIKFRPAETDEAGNLVSRRFWVVPA